MARIVPTWICCPLVGLTLALGGCRQEMSRQPSYRPLQASTFFEDGRSARPLVTGTVARGTSFVSGRRSPQLGDYNRVLNVIGNLPGNPLGATAFVADWSSYVDGFPEPITRRMLERGQERYNIFCAVCHDRAGTGRGIIVQRGFTQPPSFHTDLSRGFKLRGVDLELPKAPVGYYLEVITRGFGAMPDHAAQIPAGDRWAIIAYIRALQLSQRATLADVREEEEMQKLLQSRGPRP